MIRTTTLTLLSDGRFQAHAVTGAVRDAVAAAGIREGSVLVYYTHTTGGLIIVEHEAGFVVDLEDMLERLAPTGADYKHHLRGYDFNGSAHLRTALLGVSVVVPVLDGELLLGGYQDIVAIDMDPEAKARKVIIQVTGE